MIICLNHQKGGVGKSSLSTNLAVALNAVMVDVDRQQHSFKWNKLRKMNGYDPVTCYTATDPADFRKIIKENENRYIVIDTGGFDSGMNRIAVLAADIVITPAAPSQPDIFGLQDYEVIIKDISLDAKQHIQTNILINRADVRCKKDIRNFRKYVHSNEEYFNLLDTIIHDRKDYKTAYGKGLSVIEFNPTGAAADEIRALIKELTE